MTPEQLTEFNKLVDEVNALKKELDEAKTSLELFKVLVKKRINQIVEAING